MKFFAYSPDEGVVVCDTEAEAYRAAEEMIAELQDNEAFLDACQVCWGKLMGRAAPCGGRNDYELCLEHVGQ